MILKDKLSMMDIERTDSPYMSKMENVEFDKKVSKFLSNSDIGNITEKEREYKKNTLIDLFLYQSWGNPSLGKGVQKLAPTYRNLSKINSMYSDEEKKQRAIEQGLLADVPEKHNNETGWGEIGAIELAVDPPVNVEKSVKKTELVVRVLLIIVTIYVIFKKLKSN